MRHLLVLLTLAVCLPAPAKANSIGIYANPQGTVSVIFAWEQVLTTFYILASTTPPGITHAEFRVTGGPTFPDAVVTSVPNPASLVALGDPFGSGANIGFPSCQAPDGNGNILLYSVQIVVLDFAQVQDIVLEVVAHDQPTNPQFDFINLLRCDDAVPTQAVGRTALLNPKPLSVENATWGGVKRLFLD